MYIIFALLVPAAFIYYIAGADEDLISTGIPYVAGIIAGILAVFITSILNSFLPMQTSLPVVKFILIFLSETIIPMVLGNLALFFIFHAPIRQKISRIRQQSFGIMTIYLPYIMISSYTLPDLWCVLLIPVMTVSILFLLDFYIGRMVVSPNSFDPLDFIVSCSPVFIAMIIADVAKTLWYFKFSSWIFIPLSLAVAAFSFVLRCAKYRK